MAHSDPSDPRRRRELRLATLTLDQLLGEEPFPRWNQHPPFPPPEFVAAARKLIRTVVGALRSSGPKPTEAKVRAALKACVEWFNEKDAEFGCVIETEEREDIFACLEDIAAAAGHPRVVDEIDEWRGDW